MENRKGAEHRGSATGSSPRQWQRERRTDDPRRAPTAPGQVAWALTWVTWAMLVEAVGQLLVGMDGIYSGWLGKLLWGTGQKVPVAEAACLSGPWVVQVLLWLSTAQVWGLPAWCCHQGKANGECHFQYHL